MKHRQIDSNRIFQITSKINSSDDLSTLLDSIIETTREFLNVEGCSLLLYNKEEDHLVFHNSKGLHSDKIISLKVPRGKGIAGLVLDTLQPVIVNNADEDERIYRHIDESIGFKTRNLICVPMVTNGEIWGVIEAVNCLERTEFSPTDLIDLENLSEIAAIAIKNRMLINDLTDRLQDINNLLKVTETLYNIHDLKGFFENTISILQEVMNVKRVSYIFKNHKSGSWHITTVRGFNLFKKDTILTELSPILTKVYSTGQPFMVENSDFLGIQLPFKDKYATKSFLSFPIVFKENQIIGFINLADRLDHRPFNNNDLKLLTIIVRHLVEKYKTLLVKNEQVKIESFRRDLKIASKIQRYSLPEIPSQMMGLELASLYLTSREVGGDFYDLIYHNNQELSFVIADVSGKGISAALVMEFSKTVISDEVTKTDSLSLALTRSGEIIQKKFKGLMHLEVMVVKISILTKQLTFASAGHHRQFLYRKKTNQVDLLIGKGVPIGTPLHGSYISQNELHYETGDMLVLYTDGITETRNKESDFFGEERLIELIEKHATEKLDTIITNIKIATDTFRGNTDLEDDCTVLLVRL
jgi:phosphoserine phosphatase RsbU/P